MKIVNFSMIRKIVIPVFFTLVIVGSLYYIFTYKKASKNDLKKFTDLIPNTVDSATASSKPTILTGVIGSNKPVKGKIFFDSFEIEIDGTSFSTTELSPGYYSITVQDSAGDSYLTTPTNIQIFPGKNNLKISVFN